MTPVRRSKTPDRGKLVPTTYIGGPLDGECDEREQGQVSFVCWLRTPSGPGEYRYERQPEPDEQGRVVFEYVAAG